MRDKEGCWTKVPSLLERRLLRYFNRAAVGPFTNELESKQKRKNYWPLQVAIKLRPGNQETRQRQSKTKPSKSSQRIANKHKLSQSSHVSYKCEEKKFYANSYSYDAICKFISKQGMQKWLVMFANHTELRMQSCQGII